MNNNKSLSSLLITMLALYGANASAMENNQNPNIRRGKSVEKQQHITKDFRNFKLGKAESLLENPKFKKDHKQYVIQYAGPALDDFLSKYELVLDQKSANVMYNYGLEGRKKLDRLASGNAGTVTKCRLKGTNREFAVKCEPNPSNTGAITENNQTVHADDNKNESIFYKESSEWWPEKKWCTKKYDKFKDENVSYTVTDWVEGKTLRNWFDDIKDMEKNPSGFASKLANFIEEYNKILNDLTSKNRINSGLHEDNVMVENSGKLIVVDNGRYRKPREGENLEETCARQIARIFNLFSNQWRWKSLIQARDRDLLLSSRASYTRRFVYDPNSSDAKLSRLYFEIRRALKCINRTINENGEIVLLPRSSRQPFRSKTRNEMQGILRSVAADLKNIG